MRLPYRHKKTTLWVLFGIIVVTMFLFKFTELRPNCLFKDGSVMLHEEKYVMDENQKVYSYSRETPIIFIGGVPRSGTTLMRAMLDAHPDVRCGQETRVIPRILQLRSHWLKSEKESLRLKEAGITKEVMNSAIAQFCLEIIAKHGDPAPRLCNKDPLTLKMGTYVIELFPNAKFLFMVRDGRATVHSIISRKVTITGFDLSSYRQCMQKWNQAIEVMHDQCKEIGKEGCMMVYYEQLVLHPEEWMRKILKFLDVPWNDAVLHHEEFINKPNGVPLSKVERSSDQVIKPVNLEALSKWVGHIPENVVRDMADLAPMLSILGYDPYANPPDYGKPDAWVQDNTYKLKANRDIWENKAKEVLRLHSNDEDEMIDNNFGAIVDHNVVKQSNENNAIETIGNIAEQNNNDKLNYENINNSKKQLYKTDLNNKNNNKYNYNNNNNNNKGNNDMDYDDGYNSKNHNNNKNDNHINDNDNNNQQAKPKEIITIKQLNDNQQFNDNNNNNNKDKTIDGLYNKNNKNNMSERT